MLNRLPPNYSLLLCSLDDERWSALHRLVLNGRERLRQVVHCTKTVELLYDGGPARALLLEGVAFWSLPRMQLIGSEAPDSKLKAEYLPETEGSPAQLNLNLNWLERLGSPIVRSDAICWLILKGSVKHGILHLDGGPQADCTVNAAFSTVMERAHLRLRTIRAGNGAIGAVLLPARGYSRRRTESFI